VNLSDTVIGEKAAPQDQAQSAPRTIFASSPIQLRAAAHLYGIETVPLAQARVLELGCGVGDNLFPFALGYPGAHVVGVDANPEDVQKARVAAATLGASNVKFHVMGEVDLVADLGQFDYIVLHQTYGTVPDELGHALLGLCKQLLSPLGLAFVSYHTLPGWKGKDVLRDAMLFASHAASGITESIAEARTMLTMLSECLAGNGQSSPLAPMLEYTRGLSDDELATEFLQDAAPSAPYFIEFANTVVQHGLTHIGDAEPEQEMPLTFGGKVALFNSLKGLGQTAAVRQQYLDFAVGRRFRQSMLVHQERAGQCLSAPDLTRLEDLRFAGVFRMHRPEMGQPINRRRYTNQAGRSFVTEDTRVSAVMAALTAAWPATCTMADLVAAMPDQCWEDKDVLRQSVRKALETMLRAGVLRIASEATPYDADTSATLRLLPHLRAALEAHPDGGSVGTWTLWHAPVELALSAAEVDFLRGDDATAPRQLWLQSDGGPAAADAAQAYPLDIPGLIERLRDHGLLSGSAQAWAEHYQALCTRNDWRHPAWWHHLEAQFSHSMRAGGRAAAVSGGLPPPVRAELSRIQALWKDMRLADVEAALQALVKAHPPTADAWRSLARVLKQLNRGEDALVAMGRAAVLKPLDADVQGEFSDMLIEHRRYLSAEQIANRAVLLKPDDPVKYNRLALALRWARKFDSALRCLEASLKLDPKLDRTHNMLGIVYSEGGDLDMAEASYRRALELNPQLHAVQSNMLFLMSHRASYSAAALFREHRKFGEMAARRAHGQVHKRHANDRDPGRPLRIGFVSGDLRQHAVMNFLEPIWDELDREQFQIYAYHTGERDDATSERVKALTKSWHRVRTMTEAQLRDRIVEDRIDILFDLSGHTDGNRLTAFAMRPAPVQVSWIGYPGTTGLAEMDYFIIDSHAAEPGVLDAQFTEKLVYLPAAFTFRPSPDSSPVSASPAAKNGYLTFGSFNRHTKISDDVLALWARVLTRVPDSKILMGNMDADLAPRVKERFAKFGVTADRIRTRANAPMKTYLALHHEVDIALDTFPYTGGTTTCHSLWMGVPILALTGETRVSRQTSGVMRQVGLDDWVSDSADELVEKAARWAGDLPGLAAHRAAMRQRIEASSLLRPDFVARGLEKAMRKMWVSWCASEPVTSFTIEP
jgi:predicted O-linked N-acetylglucosamine transferase (SPINDLY family)/SAM-dependent methyltransferase